MEITSANINKKNPMSVDVHTYKGEEITQTIDKSPKKVMIIGSAVAELIVKFEQQEKVVGFAYSDQTDSKFAEEIEKLPLVSKMWPSKESIITLQPDLNYSISSRFREELLGSILGMIAIFPSFTQQILQLDVVLILL